MTINKTALVEIAEKNPAAEALLMYAACRERNVRNGISTFASIRDQLKDEGFGFTPQQLLSTLREFERMGFGAIIDKDKFKWNVSILQLGKVVKSIEALRPPVKTIEIPPAPIQKSVLVCLDKTRQVEIHFPGDLTSEELQFISGKVLQQCP